MKTRKARQHARRTILKFDTSSQRLPSVFELAVLAALNNGNFKQALQSYVLAEEYLNTKAQTELNLWRKMHGTIEERIEAFSERVRSGELKGEDGQVAYEELKTRVLPRLRDVKLFMDERDDSVKQAIRELTGRSCSADTARDYLRAAWMRSQLEERVAVDSRNMPTGSEQRGAAIKSWNKWCDEHRSKCDKSLVFTEGLLNATLKWIGEHVRLGKT